MELVFNVVDEGVYLRCDDPLLRASSECVMAVFDGKCPCVYVFVICDERGMINENVESGPGQRLLRFCAETDYLC